MKRRTIFCIVMTVLAMIIILCQTAVDPEAFAGHWYSSADQTMYLFQEGLIYSSKHGVELSDTDTISGAYTFCRDSVVLFIVGMDGLEKEKELFLLQKGDGSFLCEHKDGSGKTYLIRYNK